MPTRTLVVLIAVLLPLAARAQRASTVPAPAIRTATAFLRAVERGDWRAAGALIDSASLERERRSAAHVVAPDSVHHMTAEDVRRMDPGMPDAVVDYTVKKANERRIPDSWLRHEFAGVSTPDSLRVMPFAEVAARWVEAKDERYQMREALAEVRGHGCAPTGAADDSLLHALAPRYAVRGAFTAPGRRAKDPRMVWVAFERLFKEDEEKADSADRYYPAPMLMLLRPTTSGWRVVADPMLFGGGAMVISSDLCEGKAPSAQ